ncbi:MAG: ABC-F family ATP-binding cassette domain-containing protein [Proteobacteria bacterium]|nr:ABC-F family ATP-binding cassette domain-containing protein [Pseudomonadota bacterium]
MLRVDRLTLSAGGRELLVDVALHLRPGERIGLVGRNGAGKTTLLRAVAGQHEADAGSVLHRGRLGYLPQTAVSESTSSVWDEVADGLQALKGMERALDAATDALDGTPESIAVHADLAERFEAAGGYAMDKKVGTVLHGLGFPTSEWERPVPELSGGWQMRVALARLLVEGPDVLLLDEPTNHLDLHARAWLAGHLAQHPGALVLVSHDRFVLDRCVSGIVELRAQALDRYSVDFTRYLVERQLRDDLRQSTLEKQGDEAAKLTRFVERFGAKATKAKQAQSRAKRLEKLVASMEELSPDAPPPKLAFKVREARSSDVIGLRDAAGGYGEALFTGLDLGLHRRESWVLLGPNGCGKSTLLKLLSGQLRPMEGRRLLGKGVRVGLYEQDQARALDRTLRAVDHVTSVAPLCTETQARSALGALGLSGEKALQQIGTLSGGEKARVALAALSVQAWDVLLLDEPTNHLDVVSVGVLVEALRAFEGVVVVVSHDRFLVEELATHVVAFSPAGLEVTEGLRPEHLEPAVLGRPDEDESASRGESHKERQRCLRELERMKKELAATEARVTELEGSLEALDGQLAEVASDVKEVTRLLGERAVVEQELEAAMALWEELAERV